MRAAAVIPARNEEATVGGVVGAARRATLVDEVVVVDNGSRDATAAVAAAHGARVVAHPSGGKGEAMAAGVAATEADVIVFLDADLVGLRPDHVDRLVASVTLGGKAMARGLFDRGVLLNPVFVHVLLPLTGERAVRRELFESLPAGAVRGYRVEAALNARAREVGADVASFVLDGLFHRTKEVKHANAFGGWAEKVAMLVTAAWAYVAHRTTSRRRRA